jgi:protein TonB
VLAFGHTLVLWNGGVMLERSGLVAIALAVSLLCADGCARNPPPPTPAATPAPTSDKTSDQSPGAVDEVTRRLESDARLDLPPGTEQDLGDLHLDPQGADFTLWIIAFKKEIYRNWIVPQAAKFGSARGHVSFEFTVERNGSLSALRMLKSSGTPSLDQAAQDALSAGKFTALPNDYRPPRLTMQVTLFYNERPK